MIQFKTIDGLLLRDMVMAGTAILEKNRERWKRNYENETPKERENRLAHERALRQLRLNPE